MATPPLNSTTSIVDDTNPALVYSGLWINGGSAFEYNTTTHGSTSRASSVQFTFRGTSVAVYGTVGLDTPSSAYAIDGTSPSIYAAGRPRATVFQQMFFQSPPLSDGEHTLLVTNLGTGALWIDYIIYTPSAPPTSSSLPPSTLPLSPTLTSSQIVSVTPSDKPVINSPTSEPSSTGDNSSGTGAPSQDNSNSKSSIPAAAVAGGAIGALILIIALVFGMLYYRKRARRLAGTRSLEKEHVLGDSSEFDKTDPGIVVTPFTSAYTYGSHTSSGYGSTNMNTYPSAANMYPPGSVYPPSDYGYPNQNQPSTPIYHFSNHYDPRAGYVTPSENIAGAGANHGYGGMGQGDSRYGGTQYGYTNPIDPSDYLQNPHPQYDGVQQQTYTSTDRLAAPQRRGSLESAESQTSLAYLSSDRVAMNPSSPLPDTVPGSPPTQATQRTEKGGLVVHNDSTPELRQHEDGGVRLDVQRPQGSSSAQQQVIDLPPVYKPNY